MDFYNDMYDIGYGGDGLKEGVDYYMSPDGFRVMTEEYLARRGYCCANGCRHCPYWPKALKGNTVLRKK
jgi:hypothetical protein